MSLFLVCASVLMCFSLGSARNVHDALSVLDPSVPKNDPSQVDTTPLTSVLQTTHLLTTATSNSNSITAADSPSLTSKCAQFVNGKCLACHKGSALDALSLACHLCPSGYYQDQEMYTETACSVCPSQTSCRNAECESTYSSSMYPGAPNQQACNYPLPLSSKATWITFIVVVGILICATFVLCAIPKYKEDFILHFKWWALMCALTLYIVNDIAKYDWVVGLRQSDYTIILNPTVRVFDYILIAAASVLFIIFIFTSARLLTFFPLFLIVLGELAHFLVNLWMIATGVTTAPLYFYDDTGKPTPDQISIPPFTQYRHLDTILLLLVTSVSLLHSFFAINSAIRKHFGYVAPRDLIK